MTSLFSQPKTPTPLPPPTMPDAQNPAVIAAQRRQQQDDMMRAGRTSTILTSAANRAPPAPVYSSAKLGAG